MLFVLVLGSMPVSFLYNGVLRLITFIFFKKDNEVRDEGLEDEYDEDDRYEILASRKKAIEELAATLDDEDAEIIREDVEVVLEREEEKGDNDK